jgi:tetratricopeptide (TPR) repeat protein
MLRQLFWCVALFGLNAGAFAAEPSREWMWCIKPDGEAGNPDLAITGCTTVIKAGKENRRDLAIAHYDRGLAYHSKGDYERAITDFDQAISLDSTYVDAFNSRGSAYGMRGEYARGIEDFNEAIRLQPEYERAFHNRGTAHINLGNYGRAIEDFDQALRLKPDDGFALNNRCWARALANLALDKALGDCNEALRLLPGNWNVLSSRGFVFFRMLRYDKAMDDYSNCIQHNPQSAPCLYMRGVVKSRLGGPRSGTADISAAKVIDPKISETYAGYGAAP